MRRLRPPGDNVGDDPHQRSQSRQGPLRPGRARARPQRSDAEARTEARNGALSERARRAPRPRPAEGVDVEALVREAPLDEAFICEADLREAHRTQALGEPPDRGCRLIPGVDDKVRAFLERNHSAAVATIKPDGTPHVARIGIGLIDDVVWSSGTRNRVRTRNLRRDPRATLFVFDPQRWQSWMGIESHVRILDGPDAPEHNLKLYRALAGEPDDVEEYLA